MPMEYNDDSVITYDEIFKLKKSIDECRTVIKRTGNITDEKTILFLYKLKMQSRILDKILMKNIDKQIEYFEGLKYNSELIKSVKKEALMEAEKDD